MVPIDQIRRLEYAVREAQANLARAHAENHAANLAWERMITEAEAQIAAGRSVSAEFICGSAARARANGADGVPLDNVLRGFLNFKDRK
jgi:hypothetical protein